jgi:LysR family cyn operon transcriptional activator
MELRHYKHVLALADHASFRKASEALGISQPALTKNLFQIEREVGQRLFDRHGQTISLRTAVNKSRVRVSVR